MNKAFAVVRLPECRRNRILLETKQICFNSRVLMMQTWEVMPSPLPLLLLL